MVPADPEPAYPACGEFVLSLVQWHVRALAELRERYVSQAVDIDRVARVDAFLYLVEEPALGERDGILLKLVEDGVCKGQPLGTQEFLQ